MDPKQLLKNSFSRIPWGLVGLLILLLGGSVAVASLSIPAVYVFLIVFVLPAGIISILCCVHKPNWVLYATLFMIFLPAGLIPSAIQSTFNRLLTIAVFGSWLANLLIHRQKIIVSGAAASMFVFIAWALVTIFWAKNTSVALTTIQMYILRFILFLLLVPNLITNPGRLNIFFSVLASIGWIFVLTNIVLVLQNGITPGERFKVLDVNENEAGLLMLTTLMGVLWRALRSSPKYQTINNMLTGVFIISAIGLTGISGSRGSAISLVYTLLTLGLWKTTRPWAIFSLVIVLLAAIIVPAIFITTVERFADLSGSSSPLGDRSILWQAAWQIITEHPLEGVGIGGSSFAILPYIQSLTNNGGSDGVSIHNPILVVWSETGLPGIIFYISALAMAAGSFVKQYFRYLPLDNNQKFLPYFAIVTSIFLGYMFSWIKGGGMQTSHIYFLLIALLSLPATLDPVRTASNEH